MTPNASGARSATPVAERATTSAERGAESVADVVWGNAKIEARRGVVELYISYVRRKLASSREVRIGMVPGAGHWFEARQ